MEENKEKRKQSRTKTYNKRGVYQRLVGNTCLADHIQSNTKAIDFNQGTTCGAHVRWSKYTTVGL